MRERRGYMVGTNFHGGEEGNIHVTVGKKVYRLEKEGNSLHIGSGDTRNMTHVTNNTEHQLEATTTNHSHSKTRNTTKLKQNQSKTQPS